MSTSEMQEIVSTYEMQEIVSTSDMQEIVSTSDMQEIVSTSEIDILILLTSPFKSTKFTCYSNIQKQRLFHFHLHR